MFYDYDEIDYLTDCNFRRIPPPPPGCDDMSNDVWYPVGPKDVFPEEFATFLLTDPRTRECFLYYHADLLDAAWWQAMQHEHPVRAAGRGAVLRRRGAPSPAPRPAALAGAPRAGAAVGDRSRYVLF